MNKLRTLAPGFPQKWLFMPNDSFRNHPMKVNVILERNSYSITEDEFNRMEVVSSCFLHATSKEAFTAARKHLEHMEEHLKLIEATPKWINEHEE